MIGQCKYGCRLAAILTSRAAKHQDRLPLGRCVHCLACLKHCRSIDIDGRVENVALHPLYTFDRSVSLIYFLDARTNLFLNWIPQRNTAANSSVNSARRFHQTDNNAHLRATTTYLLVAFQVRNRLCQKFARPDHQGQRMWKGRVE